MNTDYKNKRNLVFFDLETKRGSAQVGCRGFQVWACLLLSPILREMDTKLSCMMKFKT